MLIKKNIGQKLTPNKKFTAKNSHKGFKTILNYDFYLQLWILSPFLEPQH